MLLSYRATDMTAVGVKQMQMTGHADQNTEAERNFKGDSSQAQS